VPKPLEAHPLIGDWIAFRDDGTVEVRSGRVELGQGNATALLQIAADELDVGMDQVVLVAGDTRTSPDEGVTSGSLFARYKGTGAYCGVAVRVAVDDRVRVRRAFAVLDAGECVNPDGARNQLEGGIVQAVSWALKEAVPLDGAVVTARDWDGYPILRFSEVPEITSEIVDRPDAPPLGLAEAAAGPTAAAIGNAVFHGLGVRVRDLPLTREAIVSAMDLSA
jgi:CO/xanthine dehydrogenase Mo-binding subunit